MRESKSQWFTLSYCQGKGEEVRESCCQEVRESESHIVRTGQGVRKFESHIVVLGCEPDSVGSVLRE